MVFPGNGGLVCFFEIIPKSIGYEGVMKTGKETAKEFMVESLTKFPLGTTEQADGFLKQMIVELEKEGHKLHYTEY